MSILSFSPIFISPPFCLSRFLRVHPAGVEDKRLLVAVVAFLNVYFRQEGAVPASAAEDTDLHWMLELLLNQVRLMTANCAGVEYCRLLIFFFFFL